MMTLMMSAKMAAINVLNKIACEGKIRKQSLKLKCLGVTKSPSISSVPLPFSQNFFAKKWEFALVPDSGKSRQANESVRQTDDAHIFAPFFLRQIQTAESWANMRRPIFLTRFYVLFSSLKMRVPSSSFSSTFTSNCQFCLKLICQSITDCLLIFFV